MTKQEIYELKHKRAQELVKCKELLIKKDFDGHKAGLLEVEKYNLEIDAAEKQLAEEGRFGDDDSHMKGMAAKLAQGKEEEALEKTLDNLRSSKEYARSFAKAMKSGASVDKSRGVEDYAPLYKALTESGGTPVGSEGGFLVPLDFDNQIKLLEKEYLDLAGLFNVETVSTLSGWRVVDSGGRTALPQILEMAVIGKVDQPKFKRIDYSVKKYGDRLPISSELLDDNAANLISYVANWFGPKYILTKNTLLLSLLTGLTHTFDLTAGKEEKELRELLILALNTAHSKQASLLTNQNGYSEMDGWDDLNGRPMLVPNPADPNVFRYRGRPVLYGENDLIGDEAGKYPLYVGNFKALGTLFVRKGIELATSNVGGDAWATDSTEVRALCRLDAKLVDPDAAFKAMIAPAGG